MTAKRIIEQLLVENDSSTGLFYIPKITTDLGIDAYEDESNGLDVFRVLINNLGHSNLFSAPGAPDKAVDVLINDYSAVGVVSDIDGLHLYSRNKKNKLPDRFLQRLKTMMNVYPSSLLKWHRSVYDNGYADLTADAALFGMRAADMPKQPKAKSVKPKKSSSRDWLNRGGSELSPEEWSDLERGDKP